MRRKKIFSLLTALCISGSMILNVAACKKNNNKDDKGAIPSPVSTVETESAHLVTNSLHNVNVDYDKPIGSYIKNGSTEYKIVSSAQSFGAVSLIQRQTVEATGVSIEESNDGVVGDKFIFVGKDDKYKEAGLTLPEYSVLGVAGYTIVTVGKSVFIQAYTERGYQLGAITFLRCVLGYEMLSADMTVFTKTGELIPSMNIVEAPDYAYRIPSNKMSSAKAYDMGFSTGELIMSTGSADVHNIKDFTTTAEKKAHPLWFSDTFEVGTSGQINTQWQPCFTAHGDKTCRIQRGRQTLRHSLHNEKAVDKIDLRSEFQRNRGRNQVIRTLQKGKA